MLDHNPMETNHMLVSFSSFFVIWGVKKIIKVIDVTERNAYW